MPKFFSNSRHLKSRRKKPDLKKNFFQNYSDHFDFLQDELKEAWTQLKTAETIDEAFTFINDEALKHLNVFERLRDGYDYMDEVVGATALPALGMIVSLASLGVAVWESTKSLAIRIGFAKKDGDDHADNAADALLVSAASFVLSIACFLKSALSLITRPVITAIKGFAKQDIERFDNQKSVETSLFGR